MSRDGIDFACHIGALVVAGMVLVGWGYVTWAVDLVRGVR